MVAVVIGALSVLGVATACGADPAGNAQGPGSGPPVPPPATAPPPLRVLLAGDSIMRNIVPPVKAALGDGGVDVRFLLSPELGWDPALRATWAQTLATFDPDVIVMHAQVWETVRTILKGYDVTDPGYRDRYEREILDPWVRTITADGARVVWLDSLPVRDPQVQRRLTDYEPVLRALPDRWPGLTLVDATDALNGGPAPPLRELAVTDDGTVQRVRQTDGTHLCPEGAARVAALLAAAVAPGRPLAPGWATGPWREQTDVYPPESCPPPV